jgi:PAS domain S-box-containing protein
MGQDTRFDWARPLAALRQGWVPLVVLALSLAGVAWWWSSLRSDSEAIAAERLRHKAGELTLKLNERMRGNEQILWGAAGLFASSNRVSREEWHTYVEQLGLPQRYPGILAIGYAQRFRSAHLPSHLRSVHAEGFPAYRLRPEGSRQEYSPVVYVEPFAGRNLRAFGYDMLAEPVQREALDRARDSGLSAISGRVALLQDLSATPSAGLLVYVPVFRRGAAATTVAQRRAALRGYVYVAYFADELLRGLMGPDMRGVDVEIFDGDHRSQAALLFDGDGVYTIGRDASRTGPQITDSVSVGGRHWRIEYRAKPEFVAGIAGQGPRLVLALGALASLLLFGLLLVTTHTKNRAHGIARRLTAELQARQAELQAIHDSSPVGVFSTSLDGRTLYLNAKGREITGLEPELLSDLGWVAHLHPEERRPALEAWRAAFDRRELFDSDQRFVRPDGRVVWVRVKAGPIAVGEVARGYSGTIEDITANRDAEAALEAAKRFLDAVVNAIPQPVFVKDQRHRWVLVNRAFSALHGKARHELLGKTDFDVFAPETAAVHWAEDDQALSEPRPVVVEEAVASAAGQVQWMLKTMRGVTLSDGSTYVVGVAADISMRKEMEEALRASQSRLRLVNAISVQITAGMPIETIVQAGVLGLTSLLPGLRAGYGTLDPAGRLRMICSEGAPDMPSLAGREANLTGAPEYLRQMRGDLPVVVRDADTDARLQPPLPLLAAVGTRAFIDVPIHHGAEVVGVLCVDAELPRDWTPLEIETMQEIGEAIGAALRQARAETHRRQAELAAERGRQLLDNLLNALPLPVFVKDHRHRFVIMNDAVCAFLGVTRDQVVGKTDFDIFERHQAEWFWRQDEAAFTEDAPIEYEEEFGTVNGQTRWVVKTKRGVSLGDGDRWLVGAIMDITERRKGELELAHARELVRAVLDAVPVVVSLKDDRHRIILVNQAIEDFHGKPEAEFVGKTDYDIYPREVADRVRAQDEQVRDGDNLLTFEEQFQTAAGEPRWVMKRKRGLTMPGGKRGVVTAMYDITERVRAEEELRRHRDNLQQLVDERTRELVLAKEVAERANRAKSEFLANMSHELRTPMHAILSYARLAIEKLARGDVPRHKLQQYLGRIDQGGERLLKLLNDLLDLSKLEAGKMVYSMALCDLEDVSRAALTQFEGLARAGGITLLLEAPPEDCQAWCDPDRIGQVLANLLSNAIKFSRAGDTVRVRLAPAELARGDDQVPALQVSVSDQGVGIPETELESVFDKFVQSSSTNTGSGGTGLGLSISKQIVEDHGGRMQATNNRGGGTVITFLLSRAGPYPDAGPGPAGAGTAELL